MGAHYATMFPDRVGHLVFDSNVEFTSTWQNAFDLQPMGFQRRFESDFAPWVAKWNSVYGLGATPQAVIASYERLRARMTPDAPVEDAVGLDEVILSTMYAKAMFPDARPRSPSSTVSTGARAAAGSGPPPSTRRRSGSGWPPLNRPVCRRPSRVTPPPPCSWP